MRRVPRTAFRPGQSGNPGGRPKRTQQESDLIAACASKTPEALKTILRLMQSARKETVRLVAATFIIERAYGKTVHIMDMTPRHPLSDTTTEMLLAMRDTLRQQIEARGGAAPALPSPGGLT